MAVPQKKGDPVMVSEDEGPKNAKPEKIPALKPVFKKDGTVTAANASSINDGAAAVVLMSAEKAKALGLPVLGRIAGHAAAARKPVEFTIAPTDAINTLLARSRARRRATSTPGRSTRPSRWCRWPTTSCSSSTRRR